MSSEIYAKVCVYKCFWGGCLWFPSDSKDKICFSAQISAIFACSHPTLPDASISHPLQAEGKASNHLSPKRMAPSLDGQNHWLAYAGTELRQSVSFNFSSTRSHNPLNIRKNNSAFQWKCLGWLKGSSESQLSSNFGCGCQQPPQWRGSTSGQVDRAQCCGSCSLENVQITWKTLKYRF